MIYRAVRLKGTSGEVFIETKAPDVWGATPAEILMRTAIDGYEALRQSEEDKP